MVDREQGQTAALRLSALMASHRHMPASVVPLSQWQPFYSVNGNLICLYGVSRSRFGL